MRGIVFLVLIALPFTACSKRPEPTARASTVIDAGAEPRSALALHPSGAASRALELSIQMAAGIDLGNHKEPERALPPVVTRLSLFAAPAAPGTATVTIEKVEVDGTSPDAKLLSDLMADLRACDPTGTRGTVAFDPSGRVDSVAIEPPPRAPSSIRQHVGNLSFALAQLAVPLPAAPIGPGARFSADREISLSGMTLQEESTWTLTKVEGTRATFHADVKLRGAPQLFDLPGLKKGSKCELVRADATGAGDLVIDLEPAVAPIAREGALDFRVAMEVHLADKDGKEQTMNSTIALKIGVKGG